MWAWGRGEYGQLGDGTAVDQRYPKRIGSDTDWQNVSAGALHSLAIQSDGSLWAWGFNGSGELGDSTRTLRTKPVQADDGSGSPWVAVAAGWMYSLGIKSDGSLWAWGDGGSYATGLADSADVAIPTRVGTSNNWVSVSAGKYHALGVQKDGSLWAWGMNYSGQLGDGSSGYGSGRISPFRIGTDTDWECVAAGTYHSLGIKADGSLWAWGENSRGEIGDATTEYRSVPTHIGDETDWASVSAGEYHSVATKSDGSLWAWGSNEYGQLGDEDVPTNALTPTKVGTGYSAVAAGGTHTLGVKGSTALWAWGNNADWGAVGLGPAGIVRTPAEVALAQGTSTDPVVPGNTTSDEKAKKPVIVFVGGLDSNCKDTDTDGLFGYLRQYFGDTYHVATIPSSRGAKAADKIDSSGSYITAADRLDAYLKNRFPGRQIVLVGHSMGGLIARAYARDWRGLTSKCEPLAIVQLATPNAGSPEAAIMAFLGDGVHIAGDTSDAIYGLSENLYTISWFNSAYTNAKMVPVYQVAGDYFPLYALAATGHFDYHKKVALAVLTLAFGPVAHDGAVSTRSVFKYPKWGVVSREICPAIHAHDAVGLDFWKSSAARVVPTGSADPVEAAILRTVKRAVENASAGICPTPLAAVASTGGTNRTAPRIAEGATSATELLDMEPWTTVAMGELSISSQDDEFVSVIVSSDTLLASAMAPSAEIALSLETAGGAAVPAIADFNPETGVASVAAGNLTPGQYRLRVHHVSGITPADVGYTAIDGGSPSLHISCPPVAASGSTQVVTAAVDDGEAVAKGGTFVLGVDGGFTTEMRDDGVSPDATAADGVFAGSVTMPESGIARVKVRATGQASGGIEFAREGIALCNAVRQRATLTDDCVVQQVAGASGKIATLSVNVGVQASEDCTVAVHADLSTGDGVTVVAQSKGVLKLVAGDSGTASAIFSVNDLIGKLPPSGAYRLTGTSLVDLTDGTDSILENKPLSLMGTLSNPEHIVMDLAVRGGVPVTNAVTTLDGEINVTTQPIEGAQVSLDGGASWYSVAEPAGGWGASTAAWSWCAQLPDGEYVATARALGSAGPIAGTERTVSFSVRIAYPPASAPVPTASAIAKSDQVLVSWAPVDGADYYEWSIGGSDPWTRVDATSAQVTGLSVGANAIHVRAVNGAGAGASGSVNVVRVVPVSGVTVALPSSTLVVGASGVCTAIVAPSNATDPRVQWTSSNPGVAVVSSDGVVTAKSPGLTAVVARAQDGSDITGSALLAVAAPTSLSLNAPTFLHSGAAHLGGSLTALGQALPGRLVNIQCSSDGGTTWADVAQVLTGADGSWSYLYNPAAAYERNHVLRAVFAGEATYLSSTSIQNATAIVSLGPPKLSLRSPKSKRSFTISGYLKPKFRSGTFPVTAEFYKKQKIGSFKFVKSVKLKASAHFSYTKLSAKTTLAARGSYRVRLRYSGQSRSQAGYSFARTYGPYHKFSVK
ncbi:MAG TPA: alpha/beta fold hydrolase [Coriobacteriia bacterium]|nr:alpha/beta fold hydrolase [Coriobacteriia bacterium]